MIDTWLFTALVMGILTLCVILRGIPAKSGEDRLVAGTVALILISMAALTLAIASSMLIIIDGIILLIICGFGVMIWMAKNPGAGRT
jgi:multisubunit Na+/H+ antiporter MnhF subunit